MTGPRDQYGRPVESNCGDCGTVDTGDTPDATDEITADLDTVIPSPETVLGRIPTETTLRCELAAAARSRGRKSSVRSELIGLRERVTSTAVPSVDLDAARRRVADAGGEEGRLRERIAALRGDVRTRRAVDAETDDALTDLESAAAALSNAQTNRIAAEQALDHARAKADRARDVRERRLELRDRLENRRRDARDELAGAIYPTFRDALAVVPGASPSDAGDDPSAYGGPRLAASLAAVRVAELDGRITIGEETATWISEHSETTDITAVIDVESVHQR